MSHFSVLVLFKRTPKNVEKELAEVLAPYYEYLEVKEYARKCYCLGSGARAAAHSAGLAAMQAQDFEAVRKAFNSGPGAEFNAKRAELVRARQADLRFCWNNAELTALDELDEATEKKWQEFTKPFEDARAAAYAAHPGKEEPRADCPDCDGKGTYPSPRNPQAKWDYYTVGGRWAGGLYGQDSAVLTGDETLPFAIVTPDGNWHEKGEMGWFAAVSNENKDWSAAARALLMEHKGCFAVLVDCHI